jgi:hypothetical protein
MTWKKKQKATKNSWIMIPRLRTLCIIWAHYHCAMRAYYIMVSSYRLYKANSYTLGLKWSTQWVMSLYNLHSLSQIHSSILAINEAADLLPSSTSSKHSPSKVMEYRFCVHAELRNPSYVRYIMPEWNVYVIKRNTRGHEAPEGERFITDTYRNRTWCK